MTFLFSQLKYVVTECNDPTEALNLLKTQSCFDLVLTDVEMPEMDGIHLLQCIRQENIDVPVVSKLLIINIHINKFLIINIQFSSSLY